MVWPKRCSRCRGDLYKDGDMYGTYIDCLQCGYILSDMEQFALLHPRKAYEFAETRELEEAKAA
jgi:hypothetical protein